MARHPSSLSPIRSLTIERTAARRKCWAVAGTLVLNSKATVRVSRGLIRRAASSPDLISSKKNQWGTTEHLPGRTSNSRFRVLGSISSTVRRSAPAARHCGLNELPRAVTPIAEHERKITKRGAINRVGGGEDVPRTNKKQVFPIERNDSHGRSLAWIVAKRGIEFAISHQ